MSNETTVPIEELSHTKGTAVHYNYDYKWGNRNNVNMKIPDIKICIAGINSQI
jgi:hypothetical protein